LLDVRPQKTKELNTWLKRVTAIVSLPNPVFGVRAVMMPEKIRSLIPISL